MEQAGGNGARQVFGAAFVGGFRHAHAAGLAPLLATQARYLDLFGEKAKFDLTDLWGLMRAARIGRLVVHRCDAPGCGSQYLEDAHSLITRRSCPVCVLSRQSAGSRKRNRSADQQLT